jgi:predicted nucleotidyltransferase
MKREQALKLLREHKQELEEQYVITELGIFGSVARDEADERSDVDGRCCASLAAYEPVP